MWRDPSGGGEKKKNHFLPDDQGAVNTRGLLHPSHDTVIYLILLLIPRRLSVLSRLKVLKKMLKD